MTDLEEEDRYEVGYRNGESSVQADWIFALTDLCRLPEDVPPEPSAVADYIRRLQGTP